MKGKLALDVTTDRCVSGSVINWYSRVTGDLSEIPNFIEYHESELEKARKEVKIYGSVEKNVAMLPGITEQYFSQLQVVEAVLNFLNIQARAIKQKHYKKYLEAYNRELSSRDAEKYAEGEAEVVQFDELVNLVALIRNRYLAIIKGLESKNFMLGHLVKLKTSGFEDFTIGQ